MRGSRRATRPMSTIVYKRLQRDGFLRRDVQRMVNQGRNVFGACMVALGDADGMVTGITRRFPECYGDVKRVIEVEPGKVAMGYSIIVARHGTVFLADTAINETPAPEQLATIAKQMAKNARTMGHEPRVAFASFSNFGSREIERIDRIRKAIRILDAEEVDFEYDGEMQADMALDFDAAEVDLSLRPPDRPGQRAGDAGPAFRPYLLAPDAEPGRRHRHRPGDRRPRQAGADRADGRDRQRSRQPRSARRLWRAQPKEDRP